MEDVMRRLSLWAAAVCFTFILASVREASGSGVIVDIQSVPQDVCRDSTLTTYSFASTPFTYRFSGNCYLLNTRYALPITVPWTGVGTFDPVSGKVTEEINIPEPTAAQPSRPYGRFTASMHCGGKDPWREAAACGQIALFVNPPVTAYAPNVWGQYSRQVIQEVLNLYPRAGRPVTSNLSANDRQALVASLQAHTQAEAARQKQTQRLKQSVQPAPTLLDNLAPYVVSPTAGSLFMSMTTVPIKLAPPPRRMTVTAYLARIERMDAHGAWMIVTNLPIGAAQASAPSGYLGWGSGGSNGKSQSYIAMPGTYRISAQVSAPQPTGWSQPVEFVVNAPNKAIQRAPKMFGQ